MQTCNYLHLLGVNPAEKRGGLVGDEVVEGEGLVGWGWGAGADAEAALVAVDVMLSGSGSWADWTDDDVRAVAELSVEVDADEAASRWAVAGVYIYCTGSV